MSQSLVELVETRPLVELAETVPTTVIPANAGIWPVGPVVDPVAFGAAAERHARAAHLQIEWTHASPRSSDAHPTCLGHPAPPLRSAVDPVRVPRAETAPITIPANNELSKGSRRVGLDKLDQRAGGLEL